MTVIEHVLTMGNLLGEGALWSDIEQALYWVDIDAHTLHRYDPTTVQHAVFPVGVAVSALGLRQAGGLVMATGQGFGLWDTRTAKLELLDAPPMPPTYRFNDGAVDNQGRFWAGTMSEDASIKAQMQANIYRLDADHTVHHMDSDYATPNGFGWNLENTIMYITETRLGLIYAYDYDQISGAISNRRTFADVSTEAGRPDGFTIDSEGYLWSCFWGGSKIIRYDPSGKKEREFDLPVRYPTKPAFSGPQLDDLYFTSAANQLSAAERAQQPMDGDLFRIKVGIKGLNPYHFGG